MSLIFLTYFSNNSFGYKPLFDTLKVSDSTNKVLLNDDIVYDASDSIRFDISKQKIFLYGDAVIKYENTEIQAHFIEIDWVLNQILATASIDSAGNKVGSPQFTDAGKSFKAKEIT